MATQVGGLDIRGGGQRPGGGSQSSNRVPSGSTAHPKRPYSDSSSASITSTPAERNWASIASRSATRKFTMNACSGRPKYSVSWSKTAQVVEPPGVHSNGLAPQSVFSIPRCSAYQSKRSPDRPPARWNTPPIPVTRSMAAMLRREGLRGARSHGVGHIPVRLRGPRGRRRDTRPVSRRDLVRDPFDLPARIGAAEHQDRARLVAGPDRDVLGAGRGGQEVPPAHPPLLALDDGDALAAEHDEPLRRLLRVVVAARFTWLKHVDVGPPAQLAPDPEARHALPRQLTQVADEPAVVDWHLSLGRLLELRFLHRALLVSASGRWILKRSPRAASPGRRPEARSAAASRSLRRGGCAIPAASAVLPPSPGLRRAPRSMPRRRRTRCLRPATSPAR